MGWSYWLCVAPDFRGHHFAEEMVRFVLPKYRKHKISQVMISADKENLASRKSIEANAGILENIVDIDGDEICRYWINLEEQQDKITDGLLGLIWQSVKTNSQVNDTG